MENVRKIPSVAVLLSTYNGERYIKDQIGSILSQKDVGVVVVARDDGSTDGTLAVMRSIDDERLIVLEGQNVGCTNSFSTLVEYCCSYLPKMQYFAFADQDDYWEPEKLSVGVSKISSMNGASPNLYFCNMMVTDQNLNRICLLRDYMLDIRKGNILLGGHAAGCTMVFNRKAMVLYAAHQPTACHSYHDYWLLLICKYFGTVYYDEKPHIRYRQHNANLLGAHRYISYRECWKNRLANWISSPQEAYARQETVSDFLLSFDGDLSAEDKDILELYRNYRERLANRVILICHKEFVPVNHAAWGLKVRLSQAAKILLGKL